MTVLKALMDMGGVDMNKRSERGRTAVSLAVSQGDPERVKILVEDHGADVNASADSGELPLW